MAKEIRFNLPLKSSHNVDIDANLTVDTNTLFVDATNNRVGIGTTSPSFKLDVRGIAVADAISSDMGFNISQVPDPVSISGVVSAGGAVDTGGHYYHVTYYTALGETHSKYSALITTTAGNNTVTLTIPVSTDPRVIGRKLYRTTLALPYVYSEYFLATIANNTNVSYVDTAADSTLTGASGVAYFRSNTTSGQNISINGIKSLTLDSATTSIGTSAGTSLTTGGRNVFVGAGTAQQATTARDCTIVGHGANFSGTMTGNSNTGVGAYSLYSCAGGYINTSIGGYSGFGLTSGRSNSMLGYYSGGTIFNGDYSILLGTNAGRYETGSYKLFIDSIDRSTEARGRSEALIYGLIASTPTDQILALGGGGKVGIGTIAPAYKLDVSGTSTTDGIRTDIGYDMATVTNPASAPTLTLVADSNVAHLSVGQYWYCVTFVTALGETSRGSSSVAITTDANNLTVALTNIPISPNPKVTSRKIYRTKVGMSSDSGYFLKTISDNTTTTYTDSANDSTLTGDYWVGYRSNTTSKFISLNGTRSMVIDPNLTVFGANAGVSATSAGLSCFIGSYAGNAVTYGFSNTFLGASTGRFTTTGGSNIAIGSQVLYANTTGNSNISIGDGSMRWNTTGGANIAIGIGALAGFSGLNTGYNIAVGFHAGEVITSGQMNMFLGYHAGNYFNTSFGIPVGQIGSVSYSNAIGGSSFTNFSYQTQLGHPNITQTIINGDTYIKSETSYGTENLTNPNLTSGTSWAATNDATLASDKATWTFSAGTVSTLTQTSANLAVALKGNRWYKFTYTLSGLTGTPTANISATTAIVATPLCMHSNASGQVIYFRTVAAPTDFVITSTLVAGQSFSLDTFSLREVIGGNLLVNGYLGIGTTAPTAMVHLPAGTATANTAPLKFTSGTDLTTAETGAVEYDGTNLHFTPTGTLRENIHFGSKGSAALTAGTTTTITTAGAKATSVILIQSTSAAVTLLGVYVSAKNAGSFVLTHTAAAGTENFDWVIIN